MKEINISFEDKEYSCNIESVNEQTINIEIKENDLLKFKGNVSLDNIYFQIPAFNEYTMEEFFSAIKDIEKEKFNIKKESDKYKLDISIKILKKEKHLYIDLDPITESKEEVIKSLIKKNKINEDKIKALEEEYKELEIRAENILKRKKKMKILKLSDEELKKKYLKNEQTIEDKQRFYNSVVNNNLEEYKGFIQGKQRFNIFEEVSAPGHGWTTFHYAMHYGKWDIIKFIIEYLIKKDKIEIGFRLKSKDGRCPLLCLLKSDKLKIDGKKEILSKILSTFTIPVSSDVISEMRNRYLDDLVKQIKPFKPN